MGVRLATCPQCHGSGEWSPTTDRSRVTGEYVDLRECTWCDETGRVPLIEAWWAHQDEIADADYKYEKEEAA